MKTSTMLVSMGAALASAGPIHQGRLTWYYGDELLGACEQDLPAGSNYVAVSAAIFDKSKCGATVNVVLDGKTTTGTVRDSCQGCDPEAIDVSQVMFTEIAGDPSIGTAQVSWSTDGDW